MIKKIFAIILVCIMSFSFTGCKKKYTEKDLYQYKIQEFEICGLWAPRQMTEEAFKQYKDAGFNIFSFTNHDELPRNSETQYYIGSKRTMEALEICKKVGIDVYIAYGASWFNRDNEGDEYFDNKPFSTYDLYGDYKDIIKGVHINDEPNKETMTKLADPELIADFKKVYPNTKYMINLIPETAITSRDYVDYPEMLEHYGNDIMSKFETPYICVDCYLYSNWDMVGKNILNNYNQIANTAKKYNAETTFILQSSTGNEFWESISEADVRLQAYLAIAFGADNLQYYCYSVPEGMDPQYNNCMLERDNVTPSQLYYDVKTVNTEIQSFASAILAYDWQQSIGVSGSVDQTFRVCSIEYDLDLNPVNLEDTKHYVSAKGTQDLVVSRFESKEHGEAYMLVNFAENNGKANSVNVTFKDCGAVAVYGGEDYSGTPEIITLDENGNFALDLAYGEGVFVVPLK